MVINQANKYISLLKQYKNWASVVQEQTGKNIYTQIHEIHALRKTGGQCGVTDYYWHKLYDDSYLNGRGIQDFLGWRLGEPFSLSLNDREGALPGVDKLVFSILADAAGIPIPLTLATYYQARKISNSLGRHLRNSDDARAFLRDPLLYPIFAKPAYSQQSFGAAYLASYDKNSDCLIKIDGSTIPMEEFIIRLNEPINPYHKPERGFFFQKPLNPAPEILKFTQWKAISSIRIICLNTINGAKPIRAMWKISVPPNFQDNFGIGKHGNLLANIDIRTGKINRMLQGVWPDGKILNKHPISECSAEGFQLPDWKKIIEICEQGGEIFPALKIQHWDIALTDKGPVVLELNEFGGIQIAQMHGYGLLTEETREFLKEYGNKKNFPWIKSV